MYACSDDKHLNLQELDGQPTKVTDSSHSQIDVMLTNVPEDFCDSAVISCRCSDHYLILSYYYVRAMKTGSVPKVATFQNYCKLDVNLLSDIL